VCNMCSVGDLALTNQINEAILHVADEQIIHMSVVTVEVDN